MDDSALDLPSSPDPLADEVPTSVRTGTRRTTLTLPPQPDQTLLSSSPRRSTAPRQSPRKRTFELDVGDENAPQRILVTVEAEEALRRGLVPRKLFVPSSPSQGSLLRKNTTTTTVPLNDEDDTKTPRRRGRPRRTSNGTPMPSARKRSGTPIQRATKHARHSGEMESEANRSSDAPMDMDAAMDDADPTPRAKPKAKPKPRKTPKKSTATPAAPSSQVSGKTTGRKRGRPRKSLMPEEVVDLAKARADASMLAADRDAGETTRRRESASEVLSDFVRGGDPREAMSNDDAPVSDIPMGEAEREQETNDTPRANTYYEREPDSIQRRSVSRTSSHQEMATDHDFMSEDAPGMEPHSDTDSEMDRVEGVTYSGQDTLAHASDFSMIAVESLPSFQASFNANVSGIPEEADELGDQEELGEQTSLIIQETLKSLRESTQANKSQQESSNQTANNATTEQDRLEALNRSLEDNSHQSIRALSKSPRRPKSVPLNRQVFTGKAPHVDDSFSTLPDSILHAATPGRLPMKPTSASDHVENDETYDDSFSEVPDAVLEAATPKPAARTTMPPPPQSTTANQAVSHNSNTSSRSPASNLGMARLPTPDDTSSSNAGSFRANENENAAGSGAQPLPPIPSNSRLDMPSSPSAMTRPRAMDYGPSEMQDDMNGAPSRERASSELSPTTKPTSDKEASDRSKSLEAPMHGRRPTLSPIVRVGRTLQNVMSDRSSPDGRESSLGSPFRGSYNNEAPRQHPSDPSRQTSAPRSPASSSRHQRRHSYTQSSHAIASLAQSIGPGSSQGQRRSSHDIVNGYADGQYGSGRRDSMNSDAFGESIQNPNSQLQHNSGPEGRSTIKNPTRIIPPSDNEIDWLADLESPPPRDSRLSAPEQTDSRNTSTFAPRGTATSQNIPNHITEPDRMQLDGSDESGDDAGQGGEMPDIDDDFDLWDIEASRPSPDKTFSEHEPEAEQAEPESDGAARRNKVVSPWRRSGRRLIFKDDITSALQIEIGEDSGRSEAEEDVMTRRRQQPRTNKPTVQEQQHPREEPEREPTPPEQYSPEESSKESSPSEEDDLPEQFSEHSSPERDIEEQGWEPESDGQELPAFSEHPDSGSQSRNYEKSSEPANLSEYSMVQQVKEQEPEPEPEPEAPTTQKKPTQAKSRFFGGFDILSFFSSPATLPQKDGPQTQSTETPSRPQRVEKPKVQEPPPKQPQASLWSTGLFRPIPQKEFRPSPERRIDLFSSGPAQGSRNTIPETDAASPSASPRSSPSVAPSTPEHQAYPIIEQKKNFTPRQGQSKTSLFTSGQAISEAGQNRATNGFLQVPSDDLDPETSILTEGSEYERLPPRDKPSRWDRTLSPSKSCFRSPLKPTTPGRVVAFTGNAVSPSAQGQARVETQLGNNASVSISQEPPVRLSIEGGESQLEQVENIPVNVVSNQSVPSVHIAPVPDPEPRQSARERLEERQRERAQARMERRTETNLQPRISRPSVSTSTSASEYLPSLSNPTTTTASANRASSSSSESSSSSTNNNNHATATFNPRAQQLQRRPRPRPPPLSPTTWTKQHWIRLDEILQIRRTTNPAQFHQRFPLLPPQPDPEKRSALVGREVVARDARMAIESWHMDVVDAFKLELELESGDEDGERCAWDERSLAKRLFALIVGEERRRDGRVVGSAGGGGGEERRGERGYIRGYGGFDI